MYEIPGFAADRYSLTATQDDRGVWLTLSPLKSGTLHTAELVPPSEVHRVVRELVREADADRSLDDAHDPIGLAAQISRLAARLEQINRHEGDVADAFNGDWATVFEHLKDACGSVVEVINGGAETAGDMGHDLKSDAWNDAAEYADFTVGHLIHAATTLGLSAENALKGQNEQRAGGA
ncbi:hypothetical protein [Nonomuraea sp. NEAU-A123]|uniref:hypothetical protein n=1 Tax=Nonomuraea sp. NEAU-A123 TaxID=2839649 RepID=UPI001BE4BE2C|nr:hypothetical protein [Nonomuraea sp. NEAU-A123]MBT2226276.1 hypothetical protein [Nonomuraea sp. NEAU-A123]